MNFLHFFLVLNALSIVTNAKSLRKQQCPDNRKMVICYWASWASFRDGDGNHSISHIFPEYCTHLVYSFAGLNIGGSIDALDYQNDVAKGGYKNFIKLKEKRPCIKALLAVGGWNEASEKFSLMVETEEQREQFCNAVLRFLVYYGFDGVDLDWEFPGRRNGIPDDRDNFGELLYKLQKKLQRRHHILSVAIPAVAEILKESYNLGDLCNAVDFVNIMGYDMHAMNKTSAHAPLRREASDPAEMDTVEDTVKLLIEHGCNKEKLVIGIPAYGRTFTLANEESNEVGAAVEGGGNAGKFTKSKGFLGFNEICDLFESDDDWSIKYLQNNTVKYAYKGDQWITYDDPETVKQKTQYVLTEDLAGVMFWSIDTDDFLGNCYPEPYPLLIAANELLNDNEEIKIK